MMRSKKRQRFKQMVELMSKNSNKYFDVVWWTRCDQQKRLEEECYEALSNAKRIEKEYPEEIKKIMEDDDNWQHGFNSGMLAASRLYLMMLEDNVEFALQEFPFLDT